MSSTTQRPLWQPYERPFSSILLLHCSSIYRRDNKSFPITLLQHRPYMQDHSFQTLYSIDSIFLERQNKFGVFDSIAHFSTVADIEKWKRGMNYCPVCT